MKEDDELKSEQSEEAQDEVARDSISHEAKKEISQLTTDQQLAYATEGRRMHIPSQEEVNKENLKQISLASIQNMTNSQMTEINSKLKMERDQYNEII